MSGFKGTRHITAGRFVTVKAADRPVTVVKEAKHASVSGQKARVEALRKERTERVKEALSTASSHSTLFRSAG